MRVSRYLGPALLMVLPLALLGWIGGGEIGRQAARAENALTDHASALLRSARDRFETLVRARVHGLLRERELQNESLVLTARELSDDPGLLDVLVLERDGHMRFPHPPPGIEAAVPLATASGNRELARAEARETVGDVDGAIALLQEFLRPLPDQADARARLSSYHRLRAAFQLGGLLRARGQTKEAESAYRDARLFGQEPSWFPRETPSLRQARERDIAAVVLLSSVAIGELRGDVDDLLNAMTDISEGRFDVLSDDLLRAVTDRIERAFGEAGSPILTDILATERHRRLGRRFAADYQRNMAETMARRLQQPEPDEDGFGYHAYTGTDGTSLIALRAASNDEREIHGGAFVGVRLDVALLVNADMDAFLTPDENGFYLAIFDPDGNPVLKSAERADVDEQSFELPTSISLGQLQLRALPADPVAILAARDSTLRARGVLVAALCLTGLGGAWLLYRTSRKEAEVAALKVDLVSRVSHELKTPLALIKMYGETIGLRRTKDLDQAARFGSIVSREADRLTTLIQRILDFSRQEAGTITYHPSPTDIAELIASVADHYRPHVEHQGLTLSVTTEPGLPSIQVDAGALESALVNLLENAVKYSRKDAEPRSVEIVATSRAAASRGDDASTRIVDIEVRDRGIGIPEGELDRVFQSFYRASNSGEIRGAGLGLSLVTHFAQAHGGTVRALPREGGGSILRLSLPDRPPTDIGAKRT